MRGVRRGLRSPRWEYEGDRRSFFAYSKSASKQPAFFAGLGAAVLFLVAALRGGDLSRTLEIGMPILAVLLLIGYGTWRYQGRDT
jgi:hypothetical protein